MLSKTFKTGSLEIPAIGMGTYQLRGSSCYQSLNFGLSLGYKLIDCSPSYLNEHMVSISLSRIKRSSVFLTSKLSYGNYSTEDSLFSIKKSLKSLKTDYLDLFMLEWPNPKLFYDSQTELIKMRSEAWNSLLSFKKEGLIKHVGVCNFNIQHLLNLYEKTQVWPEVLAIELHPLNYNQKIIDFCKARNIHIIAHTPLYGANRILLDNLDLITVAKRNGVTCPQVALNWLISKGVSVVVRSANYEHIKNNSILDFELSAEDVGLVDGINKNMKAFEEIEGQKFRDY